MIRPARATIARVASRVRGRQTIPQLLANGLRSSGRFYMGADVYIDAGFLWAITIEDGVVLVHGTQIIAHDAATRHLTGYTLVAPVRIEEGAYIGASVRVLPGVTIGRRAVVGAGAVVREDVPEGAVAVGNPARVVGTVADLAARHNEAANSVPRFEYGPATYNAPGPAGVEALRKALDEHGRIYVR